MWYRVDLTMRNIYVKEGIIKMKLQGPDKCGSWAREQYLKRGGFYNKNAYHIKRRK